MKTLSRLLNPPVVLGSSLTSFQSCLYQKCGLKIIWMVPCNALRKYNQNYKKGTKAPKTLTKSNKRHWKPWKQKNTFKKVSNKVIKTFKKATKMCRRNVKKCWFLLLTREINPRVNSWVYVWLLLFTSCRVFRCGPYQHMNTETDNHLNRNTW